MSENRAEYLPAGKSEDAQQVAHYKTATNAAALCKEFVARTAVQIQGRKYVRVEGWQAIAVAHNCVASARDVERIGTGVRAIGEIRRMDNGMVLATAEGFVGDDEPVWSGGTVGNKTYAARAEYAKRAMAQTRAISRACRSAFAHVVVLMDAGLETTPAEEIPENGFEERVTPPPARNMAADELDGLPQKPPPSAVPSGKVTRQNTDGTIDEEVIFGPCNNKTGSKKDGSMWVLTSAKGNDGKWYNTFDTRFAEYMKTSCTTQVPCMVKSKPGKRDNNMDVVDIAPPVEAQPNVSTDDTGAARKDDPF